MAKTENNKYYLIIFWEKSNNDKYRVKFCETKDAKDAFCEYCNDKGFFYIVTQHLRWIEDDISEFHVTGEGIYPKVKNTLTVLALATVGLIGFAIHYLFTHIKL